MRYFFEIYIIQESNDSLLLSGSMLQHARGLRTTERLEHRSQDFVDAEYATAHVVSWLRLHSQSMTTPFRRDEFYSEMERTPAPVVGDNDTSNEPVESSVVLAGTDSTIFLVSDPVLGTPQFPTTRNLRRKSS